MLSGVMLINERGRLVLSRLYRDDVSRSSADAFCSQVIAKLETCSKAPVQLIDGTTFLCTRVNDLYFVGLAKGNVNPALCFEFLFQLGRILSAYIGPKFREDDVRNNFTLVYEILDEAMDFGYPQGCSVDLLKLYINLGKVQALNDTKSLSKLTAQITGAIDWRRQGIKYRKNVVILAIMEQVSALVSADGTVLSREVTGQVKMKTQLSGMPDCKLGINDKLMLLDDKKRLSMSKDDPSQSEQGKPYSTSPLSSSQVDIADCTFHRCVKLGKFDADRTITFVPPDGEFDLMKYRITDNVQLPFRVIPVVEEVGKTNVLYNIKIVAEFSEKRFAQNIVIKIPCPTNVSSAKPAVSKGRAKYDPVHHVMVWRLKRMAGLSEATFSCDVELVPVTLKDKVWSRPPITMEFFVPMITSTGLVVRFLRVVEKSIPKTHKWVRYVTTAKGGSYQIRI